MEQDRRAQAGPSSGSAHAQAGKKRGAPTEEDFINDALDDFDCDPDNVMMPPDEAEEVDLGEAGRNWMRPEVAEFDPNATPLGETTQQHGPACLEAVSRNTERIPGGLGREEGHPPAWGARGQLDPGTRQQGWRDPLPHPPMAPSERHAAPPCKHARSLPADRGRLLHLPPR